MIVYAERLTDRRRWKAIAPPISHLGKGPSLPEAPRPPIQHTGTGSQCNVFRLGEQLPPRLIDEFLDAPSIELAPNHTFQNVPVPVGGPDIKIKPVVRCRVAVFLFRI